jgi:hypothetical protein
MKKVFAFGIVLILFSSTNQANAAVIKNGASCTKSGQVKSISTGKFTCTKVGKKLKWIFKEKIVEVKPVFIPWSIDNQEETLITAALEKYSAWAKENQGKAPNAAFYIDSRVDPTHSKIIEDSSRRAQETFVSLRNADYKVFISGEDSWIRTKLAELNMVGPLGTSVCGNSGAPNSYCAGNDHAFFVIRGNNSLLTMQKSDYQTPGHEYFHVVQFAIGGSQTFGIMPSWFAEGSANFVGTAISHQLGYFDYRVTRAEEISKPWTNRNISLEKFQRNDSSSGLTNWLSPYGIGQVASEFIVASVGMDAFLNIIKYTNELSNFDAGFKKATGIELSEFYKLFDSGRVKWGIQGVN